MNEDCLTGTGAWTGQRQHWVGNNATGSSAVGTHVVSTSLGCVEERVYEERLAYLLDAFCAGKVDGSKLPLRLTCYDRSLKTPFRMSNSGFLVEAFLFRGSLVYVQTTSCIC